PHRAPDELRRGRARQLDERPDGDQPERAEEASRTRQQTEHDEAEPEIVGLGQRVQTGQRVGKAQQSDCAGKKEKDAGADRDNAEEVKTDTHLSFPARGSGASAGAALFTNAVEANAARRARPRATSSTPLTPVAAATKRSAAIPPVLRSCAAINRSTSPGPPSTRTRPTATVNRIMPAIARRKSLTADRPDEQALFRRQIGRDRLSDVETMNEKRPAFVCAGRQRSRQ